MNHYAQRFVDDYALKASRGLLDLEECLSDADAAGLRGIAGMVARDGMKVVEVGSWKGKSASVLGQVALQHNGVVYAVDHWKGNEGTWQRDVIDKYDVFSVFKTNMRILGLQNIVKPVVKDSYSACKMFPDESLDMVFLDADHRYPCVKADIERWTKKLRAGGVLCGHDCEKKYSELKPQDRLPFDGDVRNGIHIGVVLALNDIIGDDYDIVPGTRIWYWGKPVTAPKRLMALCVE